MMSDIFTYSIIEAGILIGVLIVHVDDLLFTGTSRFITIVESTAKQFRTGEFWTRGNRVFGRIYWFGDRKWTNQSFASPPESYIAELPTMDIARCANQGNITDRANVQTAFRQMLCALIRVQQTRSDVGFLIAKIATDLISACVDSSGTLQLRRSYNKTVRFLKTHVRDIRNFLRYKWIRAPCH